MNPNQISTISDLRFKTKDVLKKAAGEPVYIFNRSVPQGVILSYEAYENLLEELEDYHDSLKAQEYEKEDKSKVKWVSFSEVRKMFK